LLCEEKDRAIERMRLEFEEKMRVKYMYKGNGDRKDRLDMFLQDYIRKNKIYIEIIYIQYGLYIIGKGVSVKVQQA
jgi:hypothetical protein